MARASASIPAAYLAKYGIEPPKPARTAAPNAGKAAEDALYGWLDILGIPYVPQYKWGAELEPPRKYVSDAGVPSARLIVEIDGQVHAIRDKRERDLERQNLGTLAGFRFLRFTPEQARDGTASLMVQKYLEGRA